MKKTKVTSRYWEKLKDPRWQKKRLEIMEYNNFACEACGDTESTLNVHHKAYKKNAEPWDYNIFELACLCNDCHEEAHHLMAMVDDELFKFRTDPNYGDAMLLGYLEGKRLEGPFAITVLGEDHASGIVDGLRSQIAARGEDERLVGWVIKLAEVSSRLGYGNKVWVDQYQWYVAPAVVIDHLEYLLANHPDLLIRRCEREDPGFPVAIAEQFLAKAKAAVLAKPVASPVEAEA